MADTTNRIATTFTAQDELSPALKLMQQALASLTQSTQQTAQALTQIGQVQGQATQAYAQAQAAALKYRQEQDALAQSLRQQREAQHAANAETGKAGAIWQQALGVAGGIGIATSIGAIVSQLKNMAVASVEAAVKSQSLIATFAAIEGSASKGQAALAFLRTEANRIGVDFVSTATAFKGLDAAARGTTLEGGKTREIFVAISEASRVLGLSGTETSRVLTAIQQIMSKGKVSAEELRQQIGESLPGAFSIAARAMGVTTAELDKMLQTGKLMAEDFLPKFAAQIRREFGPGLAAAADTAAATFAKLGNEVQALSVKVGNKILELLNPLAKFATDVLEGVRKAEEAAGRAAGQAGAEARAGKPITGYTGGAVEIPAGATASEGKLLTETAIDIARARAFLDRLRLQGLQRDTSAEEQAIKKLEDEFDALDKLIRARTTDNRLREDSDDIAIRNTAGTAISDAGKKQKKELGDLLELQKKLPVELKDTITAAGLFASQYDKVDEALGKAKKTIEAFYEALRKNPSLVSLPEVKAAAAALDAIAKGYEDIQKAEKEKEAVSRKSKADADAYTKQLASQTEAAEHASRVSLARKIEEADADEVKLEQLRRQFTLTADQRKESAALDIEEKYSEERSSVPRAAKIRDLAQEVYLLGLIHEAKVAAEKDEKKRTEDQDAYNKKLRDFLELQETPAIGRPAVRLRAQAPGGVTTLDQEATLGKIDLASKAQEDAKRQKAIYDELGRSIEQTFETMWENVFRAGEMSGKEFGVSLLQSFQKLFSGLTMTLLNQVLNAMAGTTSEKGGWQAAAAQWAVKGLGLAVSGLTSTVPVGQGSPTGVNPILLNATGGVIPAMSWIQPLRMAAGGIVDRPSFSLIGEKPGQWEAVVPLEGNRSIPVTMKHQGGQQQSSQPIIVEIHNSYEGAFDPRAMRTGKAEVQKYVIDLINSDSPLRTVIKQNAR